MWVFPVTALKKTRNVTAPMIYRIYLWEYE